VIIVFAVMIVVIQIVLIRGGEDLLDAIVISKSDVSGIQPSYRIAFYPFFY